MYFEAYKKASLATENPSLTEFRLFAEITRELELANKDTKNHKILINALFRNSQLWLTLRTDLMSAENKLDLETKAGLISLAIWVDRFTTPAMKGGIDLDPLIAVNRQIMHGLSEAAKPKQVAPVSKTSVPFEQVSV
ncbi:flagellar biosynthesis regulator FlaF [Sneathiella chinensis]|uniref:Flagellar FlaF family protein n=1 Tax=Sneathiella chinensis TaxID=349750 RepID=A0ABQ5U183_9PROT|nr:flagellar biosynthesis regulator FlaF [Sneathiella chinensis]GLQ05588.1 hypothetical protein GCM10007924_08090 [Sneathiella chinensis]